MKLKGSAIWRRLTVITFEDIGIGSVDALTMIVAAADDSAWRKNHGGDLKLAVHLAGVLSEAQRIGQPTSARSSLTWLRSAALRRTRRRYT
ncbi:MAG: hypothetical protein WAV38_32480, partial [Xanthobacteraceae bacterium]